MFFHSQWICNILKDLKDLENVKEKDVNNVTRNINQIKEICRFIESQFCKRFFFKVLEFKNEFDFQ